MQLHKTLSNTLFYGTLAGLLCVSLLAPDRDFSENENRTLAKFPTFTWEGLTSGEFTTEVETYLADQFPARDPFMSAKAFTTRLLGQRENKGIYLADDQLLEKVEDDTTQMDKNLETLNRLQAILQEQNIPMSFCAAPTAAYVYADRLPYGAPTADQDAMLDALSSFTGEWIDLRDTLTAHKDEYIFFRTDHHWTPLGAYYGASAVLESMDLPVPTLGDGQTVSTDFNGTLYSSSGYRHVTSDSITLYAQNDDVTVETWRDGAPLDLGGFYDMSKLEEKDKYSMFLGGNTPLVTLKNDNVEGEKLLILRDSYSDTLAPYLTEAFSEIHLYDARYYRLPITQYIEENDIDRVLVMYSLKNFASDTNLYVPA